MTLAARSARRIAAGEMIAVVLALVTACAGHPQPPAAATTTTPPSKSATTSARPTTPSARPTTSAPSPLAAIVGIPGRYQVGERYLTFLEPPHTSPSGQQLGQRTLATTVWYPLADRGRRPDRSR